VAERSDSATLGTLVTLAHCRHLFFLWSPVTDTLPTILIVDDEADIRDVMTLSLVDAGYPVVTAADGLEALDLCRQGRAQIVVTDIRMPRMDGIRLLEAVKALNADIEVIVVTAFGDIEVAIQALRRDASDFITKPINDEALHLALQRAAQRYATRRQLARHHAFLERENARSLAELQRTFSFQRNLIESSLDGILGCDPGGRIALFNPSLERLIGYRRDAVVGRMTLDDLLAPEARTGFHSAHHPGIQRIAQPGDGLDQVGAHEQCPADALVPA